MTPDLEARVVRKITWRILPFVMLLYFVSFLDRVNVGFAAFTMNKAIGLAPAMFGLGGGIFFLGYFLFEVPSNLILYRVGARLWIARVMVTWGMVSVASAFVTGTHSFYALRFLLGLAEAGFFPGIILYLSVWFPARHRAAAAAAFMAAAPLSTAIGSPVSGALMKLPAFAGLSNWQWLFIIEALPAILLGFVVLKVEGQTGRGTLAAARGACVAGCHLARGTCQQQFPLSAYRRRLACAARSPRAGTFPDLFGYLSRTPCAWALAASYSPAVWIFTARSWLDQRRAQRGGDRRHDRLGTSFRPNTGANLACGPSLCCRGSWICLGRHDANSRWCNACVGADERWRECSESSTLGHANHVPIRSQRCGGYCLDQFHR